MDVNKFANLAEVGAGGVGKAGGLQPGGVSPRPDAGKGPSFEETLKRLGTQEGLQAPASQPTSDLIFSKHAVERMRSRGISMDPSRMERLEMAFTKASDKGSKDTLVLMDDSAYIMSVKNKTIVTAMDKAALKENLFTNIDSTIIV